MEIVERTLELVHRDDTPWFQSDVYRLKSELLRLRSPNDSAEADLVLHQALEIARAQGAKSLELRAATSQARAWFVEGELEDARSLLFPIYRWFTEGFDTPDLKEAKALLEKLS